MTHECTSPDGLTGCTCDPEDCDECWGEGRDSCFNCGGSGYEEENEDDEAGPETCSECNGLGDVECGVCEGTGEKPRE
jgi:DnaJ-class molecular chaperone